MMGWVQGFDLGELEFVKSIIIAEDVFPHTWMCIYASRVRKCHTHPSALPTYVPRMLGTLQIPALYNDSCTKHAQTGSGEYTISKEAQRIHRGNASKRGSHPFVKPLDLCVC